MKQAYSFAVCLTFGLTALFTSGCAAQNAPVSEISKSGVTQEGMANDENFPKALLEPSKLNEKPPQDVFHAKFETNVGDFVVEVNRAWAPNGADRFYNMVKSGYFKDIYVFRAVPGFMCQFGIHGNPKVAAAWRNANIKDDKPVGKSNVPGTLSFAQTGMPNSRSCQMFINLADNSFLDKPRGGGSAFVPFGKVVTGWDNVKKINTQYGENRGNVQGEFVAKGNAFIRKKFPNLTYIKSVSIVKKDAQSKD